LGLDRLIIKVQNKFIEIQKDIMNDLMEKSCNDKIKDCKNCDITYVSQWKRQTRVKERHK